MIFTKFLFLLSIFMLMAGCSSLQGHPVVGRDGGGSVIYQQACPRSPVDPPSVDCKYVLEKVEKVEIHGKLYVKGLIPQAVLDDRQDELEMMGQIVNYKDLPSREIPVYAPLRKKDEDEIKQGAILLFVAPPSKSSKDYYVLLDRVLNSEEELKKHLAELRKQATP